MIDGSSSWLRVVRAQIPVSGDLEEEGVDGATVVVDGHPRAGACLGELRLYLSVFDQGDRDYDSAGFLDNLGVNLAEECRMGIRLAT